MSTWTSLMMEAEEEEVSYKEARRRGMTVEEYLQGKEDIEKLDEAREHKQEILKQMRKAKEELNKLYNALSSYNDFCDENYRLVEYCEGTKDKKFYAELLKNIQEMDTYNCWNSEEVENYAFLVDLKK